MKSRHVLASLIPPPPWVRRNGTAAIVVAITLSLCGCGSGSPFIPGHRDRLSVVDAVSAPDTVAVGTVFEVQIQTRGSDGCWLKGEDSVTREGPLVVRIAPFDRPHAGTRLFETISSCTDGEPVFQHVIQIGASTTGTMDIFVTHLLRTATGADSTGTIELKVYVR
jgi:hypothetical protein